VVFAHVGENLLISIAAENSAAMFREAHDMAKAPEPGFTTAQVIRAAYRAAGGATAPEIAAELKMTTARVFRLLRAHGLRLIPRRPDQVVLRLVITKAALAEIERVCAPYGVDPAEVAARILEHAAKDPARLEEIVKGVAARRARKRAGPAESGERAAA
jgi:hypothetical protein